MSEREEVLDYAPAMIKQSEGTVGAWCVQGLLTIVEQQAARITYLEFMVDSRWLIEETSDE